MTVYVSTTKKEAYKQSTSEFDFSFYWQMKLNKARTEHGRETAVSIQTKEIHFLNHWTTESTSEAPTLTEASSGLLKFQIFFSYNIWLENTLINYSVRDVCWCFIDVALKSECCVPEGSKTLTDQNPQNTQENLWNLMCLNVTTSQSVSLCLFPQQWKQRCRSPLTPRTKRRA